MSYGRRVREIALDTETTGLDPAAGHRIVEIAAVELMNGIPTGRVPFHHYLDPERDMPDEAYQVHGLTREFLRGQPLFSTIAANFLDFIGADRMIIHNAEFDLRFLNAELAVCGFPIFKPDRALCTWLEARRRLPGSPSSLDALCRRFAIDTSRRVKHSALIDAELLAEVYLELTGGRQSLLELATPVMPMMTGQMANLAYAPRCHYASKDELAAHAEFLTKLKNPLWLQTSLPTMEDAIAL